MATKKDTVEIEVSGIDIKVEKKRLFDYFTIDYARKFDETQNPIELFYMGERILGKEQFDKAIDIMKDKDGFLPLEKVAEFVLKLPAAVNEKAPN